MNSTPRHNKQGGTSLIRRAVTTLVAASTVTYGLAPVAAAAATGDDHSTEATAEFKLAQSLAESLVEEHLEERGGGCAIPDDSPLVGVFTGDVEALICAGIDFPGGLRQSDPATRGLVTDLLGQMTKPFAAPGVQNPFADLPRELAEQGAALADLGILRGTTASDGTRFASPELGVSRAQMAAIAVNTVEVLGMADLTVASSHPRFPDVHDEHVFAGAITKVADLGLMVGRVDGSFDPSGDLSVGATASILASVMQDLEVREYGGVFDVVENAASWAFAELTERLLDFNAQRFGTPWCDVDNTDSTLWHDNANFTTDPGVTTCLEGQPDGSVIVKLKGDRGDIKQVTISGPGTVVGHWNSTEAGTNAVVKALGNTWFGSGSEVWIKIADGDEVTITYDRSNKAAALAYTLNWVAGIVADSSAATTILRDTILCTGITGGRIEAGPSDLVRCAYDILAGLPEEMLKGIDISVGPFKLAGKTMVGFFKVISGLQAWSVIADGFVDSAAGLSSGKVKVTNVAQAPAPEEKAPEPEEKAPEPKAAPAPPSDLLGDVYASGAMTCDTYPDHPRPGAAWGDSRDCNHHGGDCGRALLMPNDGVVSIYTDSTTGWGRSIIIETDNGWSLFVAHLSSIAVKPGRHAAGTVLGKAGATGTVYGSWDACDGKAGGAHLHLNAKRNGSAVLPAFHGQKMHDGTVRNLVGPIKSGTTTSTPTSEGLAFQLDADQTPFVCDDGTRQMGTLSGARPGESVTFSSPELGHLSNRTADGNGKLRISWQCYTSEAGKSWTVQAKSASGRTASVVIKTAAKAASSGSSSGPSTGSSALTVTYVENPFTCNGGVRHLGWLHGAKPGETVRFVAQNGEELIAGKARDDGRVYLQWQCYPSEAGDKWTVTATGTSSGRTGKFTVQHR